MMRREADASGLRIAHLIETDGPGGAERIVAHLAASLQAAGAYNVVLLPADGEGWLARELAGSGVAIEYFKIDRPLSPAFARSLGDTLRRHRADVAHSHEFSMAIYGAFAARRARIPHVITMHGGRYYAGRLRRRVALRAAIAMSARTVAVSESVARDLRRGLALPASRIARVPNGVRCTAPDRVTLRDELRLEPRDRLVVAVGNLYTVKGHEHLIDAVARLEARHPMLHLAIAGRGELEGPLLARARALGIGGRVHLLGLRSDVAAILAAADVFALPSLSEGLPLALLEAMFAGRPIVATEVGEVPVALAHGEAGLLVPPANAIALAEALDTILGDPATAARLAHAAAIRAHAEYDFSRMLERYLTLYRTLGGNTIPRVVDLAAAQARPTV
jgi:glycosyltransferase involved in cell wall biosynthesis